MRYDGRMIAVFLSALSTVGWADAGYLGDPIQNAAPLLEADTQVTMSAEEVVIELLSPEIDGRELTEEERWELDWETNQQLHPDNRVVAAFEFTNTGPAQTVTMYVPLAVRHPFYGPYLWIEDEAAALETISIRVDGEPVEPYAVYRGVWDPDSYRDYGSWEELAPLIEPLQETEPAVGADFYFRNGATDPAAEVANPPHAAESLLAAWDVEFPAGESRLVEYSQRYEWSMDYLYTSFRFCYPLYTGAGWAGQIGRGRITVVGDPDFDWSYLAAAQGFCLPPAQRESDYELSFAAPFDKGVLLPDYAGDYDRALVWEFTDLEPVGGLESWKTFNPDFGDIYNADYDAWRAALDRGEEPPPDGRRATLIYLALGAAPNSYMVLDTSPVGMPVYDAPEGEPLAARAFYGDVVRVEERRNDWIYGSWWSPWSGDDQGYAGWLPLTVVDDDGLVRPRLIPQY